MDETDVQLFLNDRLGGPVRDLTALRAGEWSSAYAFRRGEHELVVRFSSTDEDFAKDWLAAGYASRNLPIPRVVDIGRALGGFFALSERISGETLDGLTRAEMLAVLPSLFATLDAMRLQTFPTPRVLAAGMRPR